jgi:putative ABC transport system permease protein
MALTLAGIGIYGLLAHGVANRINEFGVRMALGASPAGVQELVLKQGFGLALAGLAIGSVAAVALLRVLSSVLFDVSPWNPRAWIASAVTLLVVAMLASWLPARRAVRVDPVVALRR